MIVITAIPSPLNPQDAISLLSVLADIYARGIKQEPVPRLYDSAITYREEPNSGSGFEQWDDPWTVAKRGWGDCDDLILYRLAELRSLGERAGVSLLQKEGTHRWHAQIRRRSGTRYEDPSLILLEKHKRS